MMARIAFALAALVLMLVPASAVERILDFVSDASVERSGDLNVTETIAVQAEGNEIRREWPHRLGGMAEGRDHAAERIAGGALVVQ